MALTPILMHMSWFEQRELYAICEGVRHVDIPAFLIQSRREREQHKTILTIFRLTFVLTFAVAFTFVLVSAFLRGQLSSAFSFLRSRSHLVFAPVSVQLTQCLCMSMSMYTLYWLPLLRLMLGPPETYTLTNVGLILGLSQTWSLRWGWFNPESTPNPSETQNTNPMLA